MSNPIMPIEEFSSICFERLNGLRLFESAVVIENWLSARRVPGGFLALNTICQPRPNPKKNRIEQSVVFFDAVFVPYTDFDQPDQELIEHNKFDMLPLDMKINKRLEKAWDELDRKIDAICNQFDV